MRRHKRPWPWASVLTSLALIALAIEHVLSGAGLLCTLPEILASVFLLGLIRPSDAKLKSGIRRFVD